MRSVSLDSFVVLKYRIKLLQLFKTNPALAEQLFTKRSIEHDKVLNSTYNFFQLTEVLSQKQLVNNLLQSP